MPRSKGGAAASRANPPPPTPPHVAGTDRQEVEALIRSRLFWAGCCSPGAANGGNAWLPELHGYAAERKRLASLLLRTAEHGESNSLLVVGPRGSGKTLLIETALLDAGLSPAVDTGAAAHVVRLSGLLHTDESLAIAELARQLRLDNVADDGDRVLGSHADQQQFLLDALRSGGQQASRPIVVVLDEFDLFAQQQHRNQSLLYNLFDAALSRQTPLCVVGVTCRLDVFELLEKRVKSRYSHHAIHMFDGRPYDEYERLFLYYLSVPADGVSRTSSSAAAEWNRSVTNLVADAGSESTVRRELRHCHRVASRDVRALQRIVFRTLCNAACRWSAGVGGGSSCTGNDSDLGNPFVVSAGDALEAIKAAAADSAAAMLRGVSVLELTLMIAMRQLAELYDGEPLNFSTVYERYRAFCERTGGGGSRACDKAVALKAFEHLMEIELVQPAAAAAADGTPKEYRLVHLLVDGSQLAETLQTYTGCPTEIKQWASSSALATV